MVACILGVLPGSTLRTVPWLFSLFGCLCPIVSISLFSMQSLSPEIAEHVKSVEPFLKYVDPRLALLEASVWDNDGMVTGRFDALCW